MVVSSVFLVGLALTWLTLRYDAGELKTHQSMALTEQRFDVAFFGNSLVLEGVNAQAIDAVLGTHSYNFALGGATFLESEMQLRMYLHHNAPPAVVALGVYVNAERWSNTIHYTVYQALDADLQDTYRETLQRLHHESLPRDFFVFNWLPAYRYRNTLDILLKNAVSKDNRQFELVQGQAVAHYSQAADLGPPHNAGLNDVGLVSFLDFCASQNIATLLFELPNNPGYTARSLGREQVQQQINAIVARTSNCYFASFLDDTGEIYSPDDWLGLNHLNEQGSLKLAPRLAQTLQRLPVMRHLPGRRLAGRTAGG